MWMHSARDPQREHIRRGGRGITGYAEAVHGIPGFASRGDAVTWDPARPFERITPSAAIYIARDLFDLDVLTVARM
jgi:hypothetical protein